MVISHTSIPQIIQIMAKNDAGFEKESIASNHFHVFFITFI